MSGLPRNKSGGLRQALPVSWAETAVLAERAGFVRADQSRIAGGICCQDCSKGGGWWSFLRHPGLAETFEHMRVVSRPVPGHATDIQVE